MSLDKIDERIVTALIEDARASYATIGALVGLPAPGAIRGFPARVAPAALGWTTEAYVELFCRGLTSPGDIRAAVRRYPEVVGACTVTGEADALLHIRAADVGHFEQVVERIRAEPFTARTRSVIVMSQPVAPPPPPPPPPPPHPPPSPPPPHPPPHRPPPPPHSAPPPPHPHPHPPHPAPHPPHTPPPPPHPPPPPPQPPPPRPPPPAPTPHPP